MFGSTIGVELVAITANFFSNETRMVIYHKRTCMTLAMPIAIVHHPGLDRSSTYETSIQKINSNLIEFYTDEFQLSKIYYLKRN